MGDYCCIYCNYMFKDEMDILCKKCMKRNPNRKFIELTKEQVNKLLYDIYKTFSKVCKIMEFRARFGKFSVKKITDEERKRGNHCFYFIIKNSNGFVFSIAFNQLKHTIGCSQDWWLCDCINKPPNKLFLRNNLMYYIEFGDYDGYLSEGKIESILDIFKEFYNFVKQY